MTFYDFETAREVVEKIRQPSNSLPNFKYEESKTMFWNVKRNDYTQIVITGKQGIGKSTWAMKLALDFLAPFIEDLNKLYEFIVASVFFDPMEYVKIAEEFKNEYNMPIPLAILDDAGVWLDPNMFFIDRARYVITTWIFQTARTHLSNLIMTTTNLRNIGKKFLTEGTIYMKIDRFRNIRIYYISEFLDKRAVKRAPYEYRLSLTFPQKLYNMYLEKREKYLDIIKRVSEKLMAEKIKLRGEALNEEAKEVLIEESL